MVFSQTDLGVLVLSQTDLGVGGIILTDRREMSWNRSRGGSLLTDRGEKSWSRSRGGSFLKDSEEKTKIVRSRSRVGTLLTVWRKWLGADPGGASPLTESVLRQIQGC